MEELSASPSNWLSSLEMDDDHLFSSQCQGLYFLDDEDFPSHDIMLSSSLNQGEPLSLESNSSLNNCYDEESFEIRPTNQLKTDSNNSWNSSTIIITENNNHFSSPSPSSLSSSSPISQILSFDSSHTTPSTIYNNTQFHGFDFSLNPKQNEAAVSVSPPQSGNMEFSAQPQNGSSENNTIEARKPQNQGTKRAHSNAQDHIIAERKRREKLSQSLIALAALIPGLKKMDKASVLGDAIKYVKELQERLKVLEQDTNNNRSSVESVVIVNKPQLSSDDGSSSSDGGGGGEALPHVEARVADKEVLLRIQCQKQKGLYVKLLAKLQSLHLFVANSSVLPFGDSVLVITILVQMGRDYKMSIKDLVRSLRVAILKSKSLR